MEDLEEMVRQHGLLEARGEAGILSTTLFQSGRVSFYVGVDSGPGEDGWENDAVVIAKEDGWKEAVYQLPAKLFRRGISGFGLRVERDGNLSTTVCVSHLPIAVVPPGGLAE